MATSRAPRRRPPSLPELLDRLERHHGKPRRPLPRRALDWVLWENAAYLVPDERRTAAYRALERATGLRPEGILGLPREALRELAALGGMLPDRRVEKLVAIAETVQTRFDGDLESALTLPLSRARSALQGFPGIGRPGADKILLFTRTHPLPALESNGLRVLVRLGLAREGKSYAATYRDAIAVLAPHAEDVAGAGRRCTWLIRAHELLRAHGRALCKNTDPACDECPLAADCPSAE